MTHTTPFPGPRAGGLRWLPAVLWAIGLPGAPAPAAPGLAIPAGPAGRGGDVAITFGRWAGGRQDVFATVRGLEDATVTLALWGDNVRATRRTPLTVQVRGGRAVRLLTVFSADPSRPCQVHSRLWFLPGTRPKTPIRPYVYALPFAAVGRVRVVQGFFGSYSHQAGTPDEYALDFHMPVGTPVRAARAGRVAAVKADSDQGGPDVKYGPDANFVLVRHEDGTYDGYFHLRQGGAAVRVGQRVSPGQLIGYSGATGHAAGPHLHFALYYNVDGTRRRSIPIQFRTPAGAIVTPRQGDSF